MAVLDGVRILVMDRSAARGLSARRLLEAFGAEVELAGTASAACAAALGFQPEVIVSGAGFASSEWHPVLRLLGEAPPAVVVWKDNASPEEAAELAVRLYAGPRR